jgi:hypothetical protein
MPSLCFVVLNVVTTDMERVERLLSEPPPLEWLARKEKEMVD